MNKNEYYVGLCDVVGGQMLKVITPQDGTRWFATKAECKEYLRSLRGTVLGFRLGILRSTLRKTKAPHIINA